MTTIKLRSSLAAAFYALLLTGTWRCAVVVGMPMIIRNDAVQLMDGVAVLGRGYSTTTNSFQGTCLEVNGTLVNKSYNYEYYHTDFTDTGFESLEAKLAGKISDSFAYGRVKAAVAEAIAHNWDAGTDTTGWGSEMPSATPSERPSSDPSESPSDNPTPFGKGKSSKKDIKSIKSIKSDAPTKVKSIKSNAPTKGKSIKSDAPSKGKTAPAGPSKKGKGKGKYDTVFPSPAPTTPLPLSRYNVIVTMRVERFYSTLLEDRASLSPDALKMLQDEEFINFFTTCGPNYARSIHRAQEITAIFSFLTPFKDQAKEFANSLRLYIYGNQEVKLLKRGQTFDFNGADLPNGMKTGFDMDVPVDVEFGNSEIAKSLSIEMIGYGLGLNPKGSETLVATSLGEFNEVMKFAFDSMVKSNEDDYPAGKIYEVEVVPWADNAEFLNWAFVNFHRLYVPTPRGLIENSRIVSVRGVGDTFVCLSPSSEADDFGKCCKPDCINTLNQVDESGIDLVKRRCEPKHQLPPAMLKSHIEINAEFVAWMATVARDKLNSLSTLSQCASALRAFPDHFDYYLLHSADKAKYDHAIEAEYTVKEVKAAIDPLGDLSILQMVGNEHDEYFEMFYQPCLSALYGMNSGNDKLTDPKYFMSEPWYNHEECSRVSCLEPNMAWDRKNGNGCVPGLLGRRNMETPIPAETDSYCAIAKDTVNGNEGCKYVPDEEAFQRMDLCREYLPQQRDGREEPIPVSMGYLVDYFCMPQLAVHLNPMDVYGDIADRFKMDRVDETMHICKTGELPSDAPSLVPSTAPTGSAEPTDVASTTPSIDIQLELNPTISPTASLDPSVIPSNSPSPDPCRVPDSSKLGDNRCDGLPYNTLDCGFDDGDCTAFNLEYRNCEVELPYMIGDGVCQPKPYNTKECGYDGGDCVVFNQEYPSCDVTRPDQIGDGTCQKEFNTAACGNDGGDCSPP